MILYRCPVRVGIAGGSTDLESFIQQNGRGSVINFPIDLYTYILVHRDKMGLNSSSGRYVVNYSLREECESIDDIKNDVIRESVRECYDSPCFITMTSDISSSGSGLASSSSYMVSAVKALTEMSGDDISQYDCCKKSMDLERRFNPLLGYQDSYGCGIGGLKRLDFMPNKDPKINYLPSGILGGINMHLVNTCINRSSTKILGSIETKNNDRLHKILGIVDEMEDAIVRQDIDSFVNLINNGWEEKKRSSSMISNEEIAVMDEMILGTPGVLARRVCGAGGGGYFLVFSDKGYKVGNSLIDTFGENRVLPVSIDNEGVKRMGL